MCKICNRAKDGVFVRKISNRAEEAHYNGYVERYEKAKGRYDELSAECETKKAKGRASERFLTDFAERDEPITEFDDCLWLTAIDRVTVRNDGILVFRFNYGGEVEG